MLAVTEREILSTGGHEAEAGGQRSGTGKSFFNLFSWAGGGCEGQLAHLGVPEGNEFVWELEEVVVGLVGE